MIFLYESILKDEGGTMRVSKRFPLAVHSLLFVAVLSPHRRVTSTLVAESTESNPVTVRNIFLKLSEKGLLVAATGKKLLPYLISAYGVCSKCHENRYGAGDFENTG